MVKHAALLTDGAKVERAAGELKVEGAVIGGRVGQQQGCGGDLEQVAAGGDFVGSVTVGEESEVADADKARGQDVEEKAAQELEGVEREGFFHTAVTVILPAEKDAAVLDLEQAMIGDGNAVGVAAEIVDDLGGAAEGLLGVDDPAWAAGGLQPAAEGFGVGEPGEIAEEGKLSLLESVEQGVTEEMSEAGAEDFDGEEEVLAIFLRAAAGDPVLAVGRQPSARDDTVQMRVMGELLAPGVEDGEEAELGAQVFGLGSDGA